MASPCPHQFGRIQDLKTTDKNREAGMTRIVPQGYRSAISILALVLSLAAFGQTKKQPYPTGARPRQVPETLTGPSALLGKAENQEGKLLIGACVRMEGSAGSEAAGDG